MTITQHHYFTALIIAYCMNLSTAAAPAMELIDPMAAELNGTWVGITALGSCPTPAKGSWQTSSFRPVTSGQGLSIPPALAKVCFYEGGDNADDLKDLLNNGSLLRLGPDMLPVVPAAPEVLKPQMWQPLRDHFERLAGAVPLDFIHGNSKVRLAVVDTTPTREQEPEQHPGRSRHGYALLNMAESLLCSTPTGDCISDLTSQLALAYYVDRNDPGIIVRDEVAGGEFGSLVDLARAIQTEVKTWMDEAPESQLILNLSIGWDGRYGGLEDNHWQMAPAVEPVYLALEDAVCRGAIVIAAAGNTVGGPGGGPWLPGGWEERPAPDRSACETALGEAPDPTHFPGPGAYFPLVYAVSGLDYHGQQLSNASPGSATRLAAYADHAVAESHLLNIPTKILTGSSVAVVIASMTAATVAYYRPDLPRYKVMELLYQTGRDLGRQVDFCLGADCTNDDSSFDVHWISMCPALNEACTDSTLPCPHLTTCQPLGKVAPDIPDHLTATFDAFVPGPESFDVLDLNASHTPPPICDVIEQNYQFNADRPRPPAHPCPHPEFFNALARPWLQPAPESVPCPTCIQYEHGALLIEIDSNFPGTLSEATLTACGISYRLPSSVSLDRGSRTHVMGIMIPPFCTQPAMMSFIVDGSRSVLNPVLLMPF